MGKRMNDNFLEYVGKRSEKIYDEIHDEVEGRLAKLIEGISYKAQKATQNARNILFADVERIVSNAPVSHAGQPGTDQSALLKLKSEFSTAVKNVKESWDASLNDSANPTAPEDSSNKDSDYDEDEDCESDEVGGNNVGEPKQEDIDMA